jgi:ketosteroid isomerase-like protein
MSTRATIDAYFAALRAGDGWKDHVTDGATFASYGTPATEVAGRDGYIAATEGFYGMVTDLEVRDVLVDGDRACALTRYRLQPPAGEAFTSDVAEIFTVTAGRIDALTIYFDSAPYV